ncbi:GNAT family N-acetyltransferase [Streptacidiphilus carbonis]|uniref:GNAT family N-acetyltransferase n=1 Tax=Streptacidiphilus carbonis TaxID=105422 RepID=UPI0005A63D5D|nr:GNAT family N-acetyltransferase [Streptacidiphilus carbonis]
MGDSGITVRPAVESDIEEAAGTLALAFHDDPQWFWSLPDDRTRPRRLRGIFRTMLRHEVLKHGGVEVACDEGGRIVGAALWLPPGKARPSTPDQLAAVPGYLRAYGRRIRYGDALQSACFKAHPQDEPHWYLFILGVEPDLHGKGVGAALLRSRLDRVDQEGLAAYLESSNPANVPLYEHFGFQVTGALKLPKHAPRMDTMWRPGR